MLVAIFVISVYLWARGGMQMYGATFISENDHYIVDFVQQGGPIDKVGIRSGDTLVSLDMMSLEEWENKSYIPGPGDTIIYGILRNNKEIRIPIVILSVMEFTPGLFWSFYLIMVLLSMSCLYLLYKKPGDLAVKLFFLYIQGFVIVSNAQVMSGFYKEPIAMVASSIFLVIGCFLGPLLIHFHLLFPKASGIISRFRHIPTVFYIIAALLGISTSGIYIHDWIKAQPFSPTLLVLLRISIWWLTMTFILALATAIYQFKTIKDTLSRNQLLIVLIGATFSCVTPLAHALFWSWITGMNQKILFLVPLVQGLGGLIMIGCFLVAIFRYRIWNIEVFIRKALLYLGATLIIILSYLFLLFIVDRLTITESNITRFIILAISVIIFLVLRDWVQQMIERIFQREAYDTATVVADFEEKLAGVYHVEELKAGIVIGLNSIFHFKSLFLNLKKEDEKYQAANCIGTDNLEITRDFEVNPEFEKKLLRSKIFSPLELEHMPVILQTRQIELVVPLLKDNRTYGFFLCGSKISEKAYSMQDISVLSLIAKRVTALFQTAALYQKDLDRQLMLERERARISQDMHDDVGASLTRISMMSDMVRNMTDIREDARLWLGQISGTSREVTEEMDQIIWALNPKNDNLEGLAGYLRRFAFEYLEPTPIECVLNFPDGMPMMALSVEVRRNIYLIVREALHNVVKHSGATKAEISMVLNEHGFKLSIKDNGSGFEADKLEFRGNGLVNMKKRMNDIGGDILIHSIAGEGTEIELTCFT